MFDSRSRTNRLMPVIPLNSELETRSAEYWRSRAEEARAVAEQMADDLTRLTMENIAASYDKLAAWAERHKR